MIYSYPPSCQNYSPWLKYTEDSCGIAVWRTEKKRERLDVGGEDLGDSPESSSHAFARTLLVARNDPPTHSCWRSVVDDNGNPIFRNNICLEDRRLTSCDAAGVCLYVYVCAVRGAPFLS